MAYKRRFGGRNAITTPYGKKVPVKKPKKVDQPGTPTYTWIRVERTKFKSLMDSSKLASFILAKLRSKEDDDEDVVRGSWFFEAQRDLFEPSYILFRANVKDRSVEAVGMFTEEGELKRPKKPLVFHV